jgi:hypothetical protein
MAAENALLLENAMTDGGFSGYPGSGGIFQMLTAMALADVLPRPTDRVDALH